LIKLDFFRNAFEIIYLFLAHFTLWVLDGAFLLYAVQVGFGGKIDFHIICSAEVLS